MFELIFENEDFLIINKQEGIEIHNSPEKKGLADEIKTAQNIKDLFVVHRLDAVTSGIMIFAKNRDTAEELGGLFSRHDIEKYYLAISEKKPKSAHGAIKGDIVKSRGGSYKLSRSLINNPSITEYYSIRMDNGKYLFLVRPRTGKTHQVRVALKSIGSPILGDLRYNKSGSAETDRVYLHAFFLKFKLYETEYKFEALPVNGKFFNDDENFKKAFNKFSKPESHKWKLF